MSAAKWKIPVPKKPSDRELAEASRDWLAGIKPFLPECWGWRLQRESFATSVVQIVPPQLDQLLKVEESGAPEFNTVFTELTDLIDEVMEKEGFDEKGCFAKLTTRSPKDVWGSGPPRRYYDGNEILKDLLSSMRCFEDMCLFAHADWLCGIALREYVEIPWEEEYRCFISKGKVLGISQYFYDRKHPYRLGGPERAEVGSKTLAYLEDVVIPYFPVRSYICDLHVALGEAVRPRVVELNPWGLSDPCLFDYDDLESRVGSVGGCELRLGTGETCDDGEGVAGRKPGGDGSSVGDGAVS